MSASAVSLKQIVSKIRTYHPGAPVELVDKAYEFSERAHQGQERKSGDPYFVHPASVASIITEMRLDTASVCAGLLHDVVEDSAITESEVRELFGEEVAFLVDGVTKLGKLNFLCKEDRQAESFRKMLVAMANDIRVLLVKLADRLDNVRTLQFMKPEAQERIARETLEIYAPLAGRLGIQWMKSELEDLSFRYLYPQVHDDLQRKTNQAAKDRDKYVTQVTRRLQTMLIERGFAAEVNGRYKHLYSIYRKMMQVSCEFEQVLDFVAFRVVTENVADCYAALGVVHSQWTPIPGRFKDYIALPKPNGYQSLHTTVVGPGHRTIEVQIRTREMHHTAENGVAAHWSYKDRGNPISSKDLAKFAWLRQLIEVQKEVDDPAEFLESVKVDLFLDEVFVFTPKGDVKVFPRGATPIDFAYSVHSEVGQHCTGARVNGSIVPLRYKMHNGDIVDILTHPNQQPSKDWLEFVATGRARSKIRAFLRQEGRKRSIKLGRSLLEREARKQELSFSRVLKSTEFKKALEAFHVGTEDELLVLIGYGKVSAADVCALICPKDDRETQKVLRAGILERTVRKVTQNNEISGISIDDVDDLVVRYARCCNPVPGDALMGWITRGRGVSIHRRDCTKLMALDAERRVDVRWTNHAKAQCAVSLRVTSADRPGILAALSAVFKENEINISRATCRSPSSGRAVNLFEVNVNDASTLKNVMRDITRVEGVYEVERV